MILLMWTLVFLGFSWVFNDVLRCFFDDHTCQGFGRFGYSRVLIQVCFRLLIFGFRKDLVAGFQNGH